MSAKASGSSAQPNGDSKHRQHHDGSSTRAYTEDQKLAVIRIKRCGATSFYDILGLESERATVSSAGIKKAYHRLSLLTHPDKNGYPGADEAFKMVSRAFQILSDSDKKSRYDQFGGDPDSRHSGASPAGGPSPFSGFARSAGGPSFRAGGPAFEAEISPEELFRQFFGGGLGGGFGGGPFGGPFGGGGLFGDTQGFVFQNGNGFRVHNMGGARPRRRPAGTAGDNAQQQQQPQGPMAMLINLLPLILFLALPMLSSLFGGSSSGTSTWGGSSFRPPQFNLDKPLPPKLTTARVSKPLGVEYFYDAAGPAASFERKEWSSFDFAAERAAVGVVSNACRDERKRQQDMLDNAMGWFLVDQEAVTRARNLPMPGCERLNALTSRGGARYL